MAGENGVANRRANKRTNGDSSKALVVTGCTRSLAFRVSSFFKAIYAALAPLPKYPNEPGNDDQTAQTGLWEDIQKLGFKDYESLLKFLNAAVTGINNDNTLLQEGIIQVLAKLPPHSKEGKELTDGFIGQLWGTLDHPPISSLGSKYKFREADGSNNNVHIPLLGAANTPYARTTAPMVFQNPNLPDPGQIFDTLLARGVPFEGHPNGISSMLFYMATIIIHDIFQTSSDDFNINQTSSYLDLSPLYGRNETEQRDMRLFRDGLLKPDCFSSKRILGFPPGCGVFLVMFNRFHNYVVKQLAMINEGGRFTKPGSAAPRLSWDKYDNDLFQTGRLITCGLYANIVLRDYVRTILSLNRTDSTWALDPRTKEGKNIFSRGVPEGVGNQVSAEFNLIYRWHSTISPRDEKWTIDTFKRLLPGGDPSKASMPEVLGALGKFEATMSKEPQLRPFANLDRLADGTLDDDDLVRILTESIEDLAGSFGPNRVPTCMKAIEMLGIIQARYWSVATLNEVRQFFGLSKHTTFEDINPDPEVVKKLKRFYDAPDAVELYPGLLVEKTKPPMTPGSGLCVNYTTSWAILSDATALVRGDRFHTIDYTPKNITNWGYNEANYDITVDGGHVMSKLIFRAFPKHFVNNSIHAHFPFVTPTENQRIFHELNKSDLYSWDAPKRQGDLVIVKSSAACRKILDDQENFKVTWGEAIEYLTSQDSKKVPAKDFCLTGDDTANTNNRKHVSEALYPSAWHDDISHFYAATTARLLGQYGYPVNAADEDGVTTHEVDLVRDVIGLANANFMAALFNLPIKSQAHPHGIYSEQQLFMVLVLTFSAIFFDADVASSFKLRNTARELAQQLGSLALFRANIVAKSKLVEGVVKVMESVNAVNGTAAKSAWPQLMWFGDHMIERMLEKGKSVDEIVWGSIMPVTAAGTANQTQNLSQAIDYYLGDGKQHLPELYRLARLNTVDADERLMRYMLEGCRLRATVAVYRNVASEQAITDYSPSLPNPQDPSGLNPMPNPDTSSSQKTLAVPAGTRLVLDLITANHDAAAFPDPEVVRLDRPLESYMHFGWGPHECIGRSASRVGLTALFKTVVGKKNLRRVDGARGAIKSFPLATWNGQIGDRDIDGGWTGLRIYMTADESGYWPLPSTLKVRWDE